MIELYVKPYCGNCEKFSPIVERLYSGSQVYIQQIICEHSNKCALLEEFIRDELKKEKEQ